MPAHIEHAGQRRADAFKTLPTFDHPILHHQHVHLRAKETVEGFFRPAFLRIERAELAGGDEAVRELVRKHSGEVALSDAPIRTWRPIARDAMRFVVDARKDRGC